jgi:hypothetical protein
MVTVSVIHASIQPLHHGIRLHLLLASKTNKYTKGN